MEIMSHLRTRLIKMMIKVKLMVLKMMLIMMHIGTRLVKIMIYSVRMMMIKMLILISEVLVIKMIDKEMEVDSMMNRT